MNLLEAITGANGGMAVTQLARQFGLQEGQAAAAVQSLLPALAGGLQRNVQQGGLESLMGALASGSHQRYLDEPETLASPAARDEGNGILGHLLGSKEASRQVASQAAAQTGLSDSVLKKMLPMVATLAMGALSKQQASAAAPAPASGLGGLLGAVGLGGGQAHAGGQAQGGGAAAILGMITPMLDRDQDGSVADDLLGAVSKLFKK